jgi:hypothetical protein
MRDTMTEHCQLCANDGYPADHDPQDCEDNQVSK